MRGATKQLQFATVRCNAFTPSIPTYLHFHLPCRTKTTTTHHAPHTNSEGDCPHKCMKKHTKCMVSGCGSGTIWNVRVMKCLCVCVCVRLILSTIRAPYSSCSISTLFITQHRSRSLAARLFGEMQINVGRTTLKFLRISSHGTNLISIRQRCRKFVRS